jgi:hypothetical protein
MSLSIIGQCPVNMNILATKNRALQMSPKKRNDFLKNGFNNSDSISVMYGDFISTVNAGKAS